MGVGVNEAGEEDASGDVRHGIGGAAQVPADGCDFIVFDQKICTFGSAAGDHNAAFEQMGCHDRSLRFCLN